MRTKDEVLSDHGTEPDGYLLLEVLCDIRDSLAQICLLKAGEFSEDDRKEVEERLYSEGVAR